MGTKSARQGSSRAKEEVEVVTDAKEGAPEVEGHRSGVWSVECVKYMLLGLSCGPRGLNTWMQALESR
jgi:hypothetical protein